MKISTLIRLIMEKEVLYPLESCRGFDTLWKKCEINNILLTLLLFIFVTIDVVKCSIV